MAKFNFSDFIQNDRAERTHLDFSGTFLEYLKLLQVTPELAILSHQRMYKLLTEPGVEVIKTNEDERLHKIYGNDVLKRYKFFENEFFGMDKTIMKIIRYFHSASMQGEESRQVLYLVGPVGSGKSSLMEALKKALEGAPPIYYLKDCPMREELLHLIPKHLRPKFEKLLGVKIEGDLCPVCRYNLKHKYNNEYENFEVATSNFSIRSRKGIGVVPPVDPNNQDTSVLVGSIDISKIDLYSEDDPRALSLNGAFNVGNRGIVEFIEVFKNETEYLHTMITATQEKNIPSPGKGPMIYTDSIILAHSNFSEWNKFRSDHCNEAILDRIVKIEVPYCLQLSEEIKIYEKMLDKSKFKAHVAPHTLEVASMFSILSRLAPSAKVDLMTKMKLYNGEDILENNTTKKINVQELRDEAFSKNEGTTGISTRFISKAIDNTLSESECNCINPVSIMETLIKSVKDAQLTPEDKEKYLKFIQNDVRREYNRILEKEISKAFLYGYREQAESLFNNYLDHAQAFVNKVKIKDGSGQELDPDEKFLRSIEEQIGISTSNSSGFRSDVTSFMFYILRNGGKLDYEICYSPLKEAIEKKLMGSVRELSKVVTQTKVHDTEQNNKYNAMVEEMKKLGYCPNCVNIVLKYGANNLWRD